MGAARILRIELRRSIALWAALLIAAAGVFVLFASNEPYGSWMQVAITQRDILQLTWPLALGAGAWQGIRERRFRVEELLATTPRPRWRRVLPVATAMAIGAVVAYLLMFAGAAGHVRHFNAYFPAGALPLIALGALSLVAAAWLGLAMGTLLPSPLTAPMLVVIGFVSLAVSPMVIAQDSRDPGTFLLMPYLQGPRDGGFALQMLSARANFAQALWLTAVAMTGLAVFAAARPATRVASLLPALLGAAIAVPTMPSTLAVAWVEDRRATEVVCTRDEPQVCTARLNSYALNDLRGPARQALAALAAKLPPAPTRVRVGYDSDRREAPPPDTLLVGIAQFDDITERTPDDLLWTMLNGAGIPRCPKFMDSPEDNGARYEAARLVAAAWLLDRDLLPAEGDEGPDRRLAREALAALRALPADVQRARVTALRDAERTCADGDRLDLLAGASGTQR